jgi:predicted RecB family nuclease
LFSRRKVNDFNERLQSVAPENLLRDSEKNFRLHLAEIRQAVIEPAAASSFSGKEVGRADLTIRQGERLKLAFATRADMDAVWQLLASGFFSPLQADVEWNVEKQRYQKRPPVKNIDRKSKLH